MTSKPIESPKRGDGMRAAWGASVADRANECADTIDALLGPGGITSLREPQQSAGLAPFAVRCYKLDPTDTSQLAEFPGKYGWKIYLPTGCLSVGGTCSPLNRRTKDIEGHEDEDGDWYDLAVDELADSGALTATEDGKTVYYYEWDVVVHAKTSAKVYGVDALDADARRLFYVEARPRVMPGGQARTAEQLAYCCWGDEFYQTVATFHVRTEPVTGGVAKVSRNISQTVKTPISVAGHAASNFDLEWYFSVDGDTGKLECRKVCCRRVVQAAAGMTIEGPDYVDVTGAESTIYARIDVNGAGDCVLGVVMDPEMSGSGDLVTWLLLYKMSYNMVKDDYRASSLVNVQVFR